MLTIAARTTGSPAYLEMIEAMERELTKVIEDFDRAVNVEALRLASETSKLSFFQPVDSWSSGVFRTSRAGASGKRASGTRTSRTRAKASARARGARVFV